MSEILCQATEFNSQGEFAAYVGRRIDWCWDKWQEKYATAPRLEWALRELAKWHKEGDNAPECVLKYVVKSKMTEEESVDHYMKMPMNEWPESLGKTLANVFKHIGFCGEVVVGTIRAWYNNPVEMSYYEVSAIWEADSEGGEA